MFNRISLLCCLSLVFLLTACFDSHKPKAHSAPKTGYTKVDPKTITDASLMKAVFGKKYRSKLKNAFASLPDKEHPGTTNRYLLTAYGHTVLPTGEVILVVNGEDADENGQSMTAHVSSGILNIYVLRHKKTGWVVSKRYENFDSLGSDGNIGEVHWVNLGQGKTGLAMQSGGVWQGYVITFLSLYDVSNGKIRSLNQELINLHSDNNGACGPDSKCWDITGNMTFIASASTSEYDDLILTFEGNRSQAEGEVTEDMDSETINRSETPVHGRARYHFNGKVYTLVEGENIVPGI